MLIEFQVRVAETLKKREGDFSVNYANVAETVCLTGAKQFRKFGSIAR